MELQSLFGRNVRVLRADRGLTQEELADLAGVHVTYLSGVENGRRNVTLSVVERLAAALKTSPVTLLSPEDAR